jgi:hypothetical protein
MQALSTNYADDQNKELGLCPICKVNFITEDETVCSTCISESDLTEDELDALYGGVTAGDSEDETTATTPDDEITDDDEELEIISLSDIEGEGAEADENDEEEQSADPLDDFDDSLDDDEDDDEDEEFDEDYD